MNLFTLNRLRRRRIIEVRPDGIQVGIDGRQRAILRVGGVYHDTQSDDERDQTAAAGAALVAGLLPGQEVQLLVQSAPLTDLTGRVIARLRRPRPVAEEAQ